MEESKDESSSECTFEITDGSDHTNLCCCYALDADANYADPCFLPVADCCCCDPLYE